MAGNKKGAAKAKQTILKRYGENFWSRIGKDGGKASNNGGFASSLLDSNGMDGGQRARKFGKIGGQKSRRGKAKPKLGDI